MDKIAAKRAIVALAQAGKLALTMHAKVRAPGKGKYPLTREQITNCLLHGNLIEGPTPDFQTKGDKDAWKFTMARLKPGEQHVVAGVLIVETCVLVITGFEWSKSARRRLPIEDYEDDL